MFKLHIISIPVGESPTGTGKLPVLPNSFQRVYEISELSYLTHFFGQSCRIVDLTAKYAKDAKNDMDHFSFASLAYFAVSICAASFLPA